MSSPGHQHHHGVKKNIVEGIGGLIIGAAAVLLAARFFKAKGARSDVAALPNLAKTAPAETEAAQSGATPPAPAMPTKSAAAAGKRPSRTRSKPAAPATQASEPSEP